MKKTRWLLTLCWVLVLWQMGHFVSAQAKDGEAKVVDDINRMIDRAVVNKDIGTLQKHYGDDFVFTHGTGQISSKESWINDIKNMGEARFASREHDSTTVEMHGDIAIIYGKLSVARESKKEIRKYNLRYVRVFALRNNVWQMISHRTTEELH
jgi:ketosteroid isomerase-like protein